MVAEDGVSDRICRDNCHQIDIRVQSPPPQSTGSVAAPPAPVTAPLAPVAPPVPARRIPPPGLRPLFGRLAVNYTPPNAAFHATVYLPANLTTIASFQQLLERPIGNAAMMVDWDTLWENGLVVRYFTGDRESKDEVFKSDARVKSLVAEMDIGSVGSVSVSEIDCN